MKPGKSKPVLILWLLNDYYWLRSNKEARRERRRRRKSENRIMRILLLLLLLLLLSLWMGWRARVKKRRKVQRPLLGMLWAAMCLRVEFPR